MIRTIDIKSEDYPESLRHIFKPPQELYVNGEILPRDNNAIAIVGTRRPSYYGIEQCEKLAYELALRGITIVSGMAIGIDTAAHRGALRAHGRTIAILGSGHNHIYPSENKKLYHEIAKNGAVISEFPPDTLPFRANFPKRNRIISGMSKGVVIVEAPERSGALITADFALEQGREVFAMPGNISSIKSSGANRLIKEGAKLVENVEDILEELKYIMDVRVADNANLVTKSPSHGSTSSPSVEPSRAQSRDQVTSTMSPEETSIFAILNDKPKSIDEISEKVNLPINKISEILLKLELKKLIKALPGENFVKV